MTNEIKSFLVQIKGNDEWKEIYNYITNLQEERDMFKNSFETMSKNYFEEKSRNKKAIEYIKNKVGNEIHDMMYVIDVSDVLDILQGEDKDE